MIEINLTWLLLYLQAPLVLLVCVWNFTPKGSTPIFLASRVCGSSPLRWTSKDTVELVLIKILNPVIPSVIFNGFGNLAIYAIFTALALVVAIVSSACIRVNALSVPSSAFSSVA